MLEKIVKLLLDILFPTKTVTEKGTPTGQQPGPSTISAKVQRTNARGRKLIESFEGCVLKAYRDIRGIWTIGIGNTGPEVVEGLVWTKEQADQAFSRRLETEFEPQVRHLLDEFRMTVSDNAFSALVSFTYNCGAGNTRKLLAGGLDKLPENILRYNKAGGVEVLGLTRRRRAELDLFLSTEVS